MKLLTAWVAIEIEDDGAIDVATGVTSPIVITAYGPFDAKAEAARFADQFNEEYDGSPYRVIVRPTTIVK
jgi:hypothetical protein